VIDSLLSIAHNGHKCGEHEAGLRACERLLSLGIDEETEQAVRSVRTNYAATLDELASATFVRLDVPPAEEGWSLFNPTILARDSGFLAIVRSSNYAIVDGRYVMPDEDAGTIRTTNILCELAFDLSVISSRRIEGPDYQTTGFPVTGLEDCRLRPTASGIGVSATVRDVAPFDGRCRIATAELDIHQARFHSLRVIESAGAQEHEKNWMPLVGKAGWVYAANVNGYTLSVQERRDYPDEYCLLRHWEADPISRGFRGGSQLIPFGSGWLACVHEVAWIGNQRAYEHRLVWFTNTLQLARVSRPFSFREPRAIEFAAGMAASGENVVITFGVRDAEAWAVTISSDAAWNLTAPLFCKLELLPNDRTDSAR
jgi:hypothetical protein